MAQRTYNIDPKRKKLTEDILNQMRATRRTLDPQVLERTRRKIMQETDMNEFFTGEQIVGDKVFFDRRKTLSTIMKFLELKPDSKDLRRQVKALLADTIH